MKAGTSKSIVVIGIMVLIAGCAGDIGKLAEVDGEPIIGLDLNGTAGKELFEQRDRLYKLEKRKLDEYIGALLLTREARRRNVSVQTLLEQEVNSKLLPVTDDEVEAFYKQNKGRLSVELDKVRTQIQEYLRNQKLESQKSIYFSVLREKAKIVTYLKPPPIYRADLSIAGAPVKGPNNAQVTVVKFEDFQCPFCKQIQPIFADLLTRYRGKIRLVHKDLPLDSIHPLARQGAEAARCADEQGKFWVYHDMLYDRAPKLALDDLRSYAQELGLNQSLFIDCLGSGKVKVAVQQDLSEGAQLGITGTPTFFINGRELSGVQSTEAIVELIEAELSHGG